LTIVGREADARDATQDALAAIWRGLPGLRDPDRFEAWATRILVHAARRTLRRTRSRVREIAIDPNVEPGQGFARLRSPDEIEPAERRIALERAFERLSGDERTILALHHLDDRPIGEIATILGVPAGTVKSRLFSARKALARALERENR
jgi:RNA polymerase sigma-70 factor (ECF subfamily)